MFQISIPDFVSEKDTTFRGKFDGKFTINNRKLRLDKKKDMSKKLIYK